MAMEMKEEEVVVVEEVLADMMLADMHKEQEDGTHNLDMKTAHPNSMRHNHVTIHTPDVLMMMPMSRCPRDMVAQEERMAMETKEEEDMMLADMRKEQEDGTLNCKDTAGKVLSLFNP